MFFADSSQRIFCLICQCVSPDLDAAEYKHVVLGLIFLKYISDAFSELYNIYSEQPHVDPEERDEYTAENVFWVPKEARWSFLQANAKQPTIGKFLDDAIDAIEKENPSLKGVLPKDYNKPALDKQLLGSNSHFEINRALTPILEFKI
ncbi:SAM-dependent DNA methyltransferase [Nostoc sp. BAE]|nr:SAM-dependent DNA methyltransferase [Nostoc commune BAE]